MENNQYDRWVAEYRVIGPKLSRTGGSTRLAYWAGFDGINGGLYPPASGSIGHAAYIAGMQNANENPANKGSSEERTETKTD